MLLSKYRKKFKYLISRKKKNAGRNNTGRITVAHQGGGHKQLYRQINFANSVKKGFIVNFEYDPNRSAFIAKVCYFKNNLKKFYYILAPKNLKILDKVETSSEKNLYRNENVDYLIEVSKQVGSCYFLKEFNIGDYIYNIELYPNKGSQLVRAGGTSALVLQKSENFVTVKLPSGEQRLIKNNCKAFYGNLANEDHSIRILKKAGRNRWLNKRPTVRGVAMNPIDHPHGGNTSGGRHHMSPWSKLTKGKPTRSKKNNNKLIIKYYKNRNKF